MDGLNSRINVSGLIHSGVHSLGLALRALISDILLRGQVSVVLVTGKGVLVIFVGLYNLLNGHTVFS